MNHPATRSWWLCVFVLACVFLGQTKQSLAQAAAGAIAGTVTDPSGAVLKGGETLVDPHLTARGFWDVVNHPEAGTYTQVSTPWRLSRSPRRLTAPSPSLGEHNSYVLGDLLGLSQQEIAALETQGIIGTRPIGAEED